MTKTSRLFANSSSRKTEIKSEYSLTSDQLVEVRPTTKNTMNSNLKQMDYTSVSFCPKAETTTLWVSVKRPKRNKFIKWANEELRGGSIAKSATTEG